MGLKTLNHLVRYIDTFLENLLVNIFENWSPFAGVVIISQVFCGTVFIAMP